MHKETQGEIYGYLMDDDELQELIRDMRDENKICSHSEFYDFDGFPQYFKHTYITLEERVYLLFGFVFFPTVHQIGHDTAMEILGCVAIVQDGVKIPNKNRIVDVYSFAPIIEREYAYKKKKYKQHVDMHQRRKAHDYLDINVMNHENIIPYMNELAKDMENIDFDIRTIHLHRDDAIDVRLMFYHFGFPSCIIGKYSTDPSRLPDTLECDRNDYLGVTDVISIIAAQGVVEWTNEIKEYVIDDLSFEMIEALEFASQDQDNVCRRARVLLRRRRN